VQQKMENSKPHLSGRQMGVCVHSSKIMLINGNAIERESKREKERQRFDVKMKNDSVQKLANGKLLGNAMLGVCSEPL